MLRKFVYNKIFRTTGMLLLLLLLLLFPAKKEYSLESEITTYASKEQKLSEVYLIDKDGYVARTRININEDDINKYANKLIEILIVEGKLENKIPNGFKAILPSDTKINKINIDDKSITCDLSNDVLELQNKELKKAIELIVYNLTTISEIDFVYINIDGQRLEQLPDKTIINYPLTRKIGVNKKVNINDYKNANKTTVYFINKISNNYYYVPVTKITNDKREKISVIIDELTSSHIYETNLMSFLNYNTKLVDYDIKDDILILNFNKFLFDDIETKNILEEVVYSISLSVRDNYDVKEVIFNIDGNEILKSVLKDIE